MLNSIDYEYVVPGEVNALLGTCSLSEALGLVAEAYNCSWHEAWCSYVGIPKEVAIYLIDWFEAA